MNLQKMFTHKNLGQGGFTLVEILIVIGIFVFIAGLGLFLSMTTLRNSSFSSDIDIIAATLQRARSRAVTNINESSHGVHIDVSGYTIFQGSSYNSSDPLNQNIPANVIFTFSPAVPIDIVFAQLSGDCNFNGPITISDGVNIATISLNYEGQISW